MNPTSERIRQLLQKYTQGRLSRSEFDELIDWLHQANDDDAVAEFEEIWNNNDARGLPSEKGMELFENIKADSHFGHRTGNVFKQRLKRFGRIAAILLACLSVVVLLYLRRSDTGGPLRAAKTESEVMPGGNKAVLEFSDGRALPLDHAQGEISMVETGVIYADGTAIDSEITANIRESEDLILRIPRGGQYRLVLEDGTAVQLNAGSTLRYPAQFAKDQRQVYLEGEAYFDVARDSDRPFRIKSLGTLIEVLGTSFNVSAYPDDEKLVTTVVSGSVKVSKRNQQVVLIPNQSATVHNQSPDKIKVNQVSVEQGTAWTKGIFMFDREDIPSVMKRIGRWYDAEIVLHGDFKGKSLGGTVSRYEDIRELLNVLSLTGHIKYKIEGRKIIIME